jgi:glyoxylase-like metal-dependent hydrolase (beta-lactamase superfamily II)
MVLSFKLSFTNCYLLRCNRGFLLIDTSYPNQYHRFVKLLGKSGIGIQDIKYVLLTHHHDDHAGFAAEIIDNSRAKLIVHEEALDLLRQGTVENYSRALNPCIKVLLGAFSLLHKYVYPGINTKNGDYIISGDDFFLLKQLGIDGIILHTPGHTGDSISVVLSDGSAFVGDVAMDFMNFCYTRHRPIFVQNINDVYHSWQKLIHYGAKIVYPAHGRPFDISELKIQKH